METKIDFAKDKNESIKITDYLDYRLFMKNFYEREKLKNPKFSYQSWAEMAGFKSRSFLRLVMLGKRSLTSDSMHMTAKALKLNKHETTYFINLVNYNQSTNHKSREFFLGRLIKSNFSKKVTEIKDTYRYLSNYLVPRVQVVLAMKGISKTKENLRGILNSSEQQIDQALDALQTMGLAQQDPVTQEWGTSAQTFNIPDDLGNLALQSFHKKSLEEAIGAINLPKEIRHYSSLILALNPDEYQNIIKEIDQFFDQLLLKYNDVDIHSRRLYQINNNLIPVSELHIRKNYEN